MLLKLLNGNFNSPKDLIQAIIVQLIALILAFAIHEFFHAWVAYALGDTTPKRAGRVTLNPLAHIDPIGTVCLLLCGFGWGKPVPYNPSNLKRLKYRRLMSIMVVLAGVVGNFLLGIFISAIYGLMIGLGFVSNPVCLMLEDIFVDTLLYCAVLFAFNLIPIPPLDGFNFIQELLPYNFKYSERWRTIVRYASQAFFVIILFGALTDIHLLNGIIDAVATPIIHVFNKVIFGVARLL